MFDRTALVVFPALAAALFLDVLWTDPASAAGPYCSQAIGEQERAICLDPALTEINAALQKQTAGLMSRLSPIGKPIFTKNIALSLKRRELCKEDLKCLARWYSARNAELKKARSFGSYIVITQSAEFSVDSNKPSEIYFLATWPYIDGPGKGAVAFANDALTKICATPPSPNPYDDRTGFKDCTLGYFNGKVLSFSSIDGLSPSASTPIAAYDFESTTVKLSGPPVSLDDIDASLIDAKEIFRDDANWRAAAVEACESSGLNPSPDEASIPAVGGWVFDEVGAHFPCGDATMNQAPPTEYISWTDLKPLLRPDGLVP